MIKYILKFEINSLLKNYSALFFGLIFPLIISSLVMITVTNNMPEVVAIEAKKSIVYTISIISPISIFLIGLASIFAKDLEEGVYDRLDLFSLSHFRMAKYKFLVFYVFWLFCNIVYFFINVNINGVDLELVSILKHTGFESVVAITMFLLSYAISLFTKKFNLAFGITMIMYFAIMIFGGMMGVPIDDLPAGAKTIANILPTGHFSSLEYLDEVAVGGQLNYSFMQNLFLFLMIAIIIFAGAIYKSKRVNN